MHLNTMEMEECNSMKSTNDVPAVPDESKKELEDNCFKTLTDGHSAVQANLQRALTELSAKQAYHKELDDDLARQRERYCLLEERINSMNERICWNQRALERKDKSQEEMVTELVDTNWKVREAREFMEKVKNGRHEFQGRAASHKEEFSKMENLESNINPQKANIEENIKRLQAYKIGLENGDAQLCAIRSGSKMMELEQRKRAIKEAFNERGVRLEMLLIEADEKSVNVEKKKQELKQAEERYKTQLYQVKCQLQYTLETKRRLERSLEYMQAKIDYGIRVPAPPPW